MSSSTESQPATTTSPSARPAQGAPLAIQRQFVNFAFYKLDPAFRRLSDSEKQSARDEFIALINQRQQGLICLTYSTVAMRGDVDFLLWRISLNPNDFQSQSAGINK